MIINLSAKSESLPICLDTASVSFNQGKVSRPCGCSFHQILIVLEGEGSLICNKKEYYLKKGSAFFTLDKLPVFYDSCGGLRVAFLTIRGDGIKCICNHFGIKDFLYYENVKVEKHIMKIREIIDEFNTLKRDGKLSSLCYSFFVDFFEEAYFENYPTDKAIIYINKNFTEKISLSDIAKNSGISVSKLCHDFKKKYGKTVFEHIMDLRLTYAKSIFLTNNDIKTKEAALISGFEDVSYFCKAYKEKFKITPLSERKNR